MAYISKNTIEEVKNNVTIQDYMKRIAVPELGGYYGQYDGTFKYKNVAQCPVHVEDTPSFRWFPETNSCYCYGCGFGGDVIALHRKFMDVNKNTQVSFNEAVEFLKSTFIDNVEYVKVIKTREGLVHERYNLNAEDKKKSALINIESDGVSKSRYYRIFREASDRIIKSNDLSDGVKCKIYDYIELIDLMLEHNKISADTARYKIKEKLSEIGVRV